MHVTLYDELAQMLWARHGGAEILAEIHEGTDVPESDFQVHIIVNEVTLAAALVSLMRQPETTLIVFGCEPPRYNINGVTVEIRAGWPEAHILDNVEAAVAWLKQHEFSTR